MSMSLLISVFEDARNLPDFLMTEDDEPDIRARNEGNFVKTLTLSEFFLANIHYTCKALVSGDLTSLDPPMKDNMCEGRALHAIISFLNEDLKAEADRITHVAFTMLKSIRKQKSTLKPSDLSVAIESKIEPVLEHLGIKLSISKQLAYCFRSYVVTQSRNWDTSPYAKTKGISRLGSSDLHSIVTAIKKILSTTTVSFIQTLATSLPGSGMSALLEDSYVRRDGKVESACAFANFHTILQTLYIRQIPILIQLSCPGNQNISFWYQSPTSGAVPEELSSSDSLNPDEPCFVIQCKAQIPQEAVLDMIREVGIFELALSHSARISQFAIEDPSMPEGTIEDCDEKDEDLDSFPPGTPLDMLKTYRQQAKARFNLDGRCADPLVVLHNFASTVSKVTSRK